MNLDKGGPHGRALSVRGTTLTFACDGNCDRQMNGSPRCPRADPQNKLQRKKISVALIKGKDLEMARLAWITQMGLI